MSEPIYFSTNSHPISNPNTQIMRVDLDGGFTVNESIPATDAAKMVLGLMKQEWLADAQCAKIRELQSDVNELKELVEYLQDRIRKLNEAGDEVSKLLGFSIGNDEDVEWACSLRFQNLARCDRAISEWTKAKEAKP